MAGQASQPEPQPSVGAATAYAAPVVTEDPHLQAPSHPGVGVCVEEDGSDSEEGQEGVERDGGVVPSESSRS